MNLSAQGQQKLKFELEILWRLTQTQLSHFLIRLENQLVVNEQQSLSSPLISLNVQFSCT